ncbi:MAG: carbon monoxide dehydrogenase [Burkholderiales bacterium]|nr:MAG: carbon monoxide dehydrogenase [Burkholderiales bacterium]
MELEATRALPADRDTVWTALNDPEVLRRCIPGCESLVRGDDGSLSAKLTTKIGPVSARFAGTVSLHDLVPPESYRLAFQGQGGVAGFAKGEAWVRLDVAEGGGTTMHYRSKAAVGGKLAQVGARLIDASARKLSDEFFERFAAEVAPAPQAVAEAAPVEAAPMPVSPVAPVAPVETHGNVLPEAPAAAPSAHASDAASEPSPDTEPEDRAEPISVPRLPQPESPDRVGVWIGVAALTVVLLAWVWLR